MDLNLGLDPVRIVSKSGLEPGSRPTPGAGTRGHEQLLDCSHEREPLQEQAPRATSHELRLDRIQERGPLQPLNFASVIKQF